MLMILMRLSISYFFAVSVAGNSTKEVIEVNKDQVITSVNASAVHDTGLICHSYDMSDVNMTNKTFVKNLFS
jgi:hypothetical protein